MHTRKLSGITQIRLIIIVAVLSLIAGFGLKQLMRSSGSQPAAKLQATILEPPHVVKDFRLLDHDGKPFTSASLQGHWSFLFFGYTNCPDVCPTTLKVMQAAWQLIPHGAEVKAAPKMYFVSVDPDRDSLKSLKQYVQYFDPTFIGVTGPLDEIDKLTNQLMVLYGYEDKEKDSDQYVVNHSAQLLLLDPRGRLRAILPPPHKAANIAREFRIIRRQYGD